MDIFEIREGSALYLQAADLRYRLFFKEHGLAKSVIADEHEKNSTHITLCVAAKLVAYGRLTPINEGGFLISQVVVDPEFQSQGFGSKLLAEIMEIGGSQGAKVFVLSARTTATKLYEKLGFFMVGPVYKSSRTGIAHVKMISHKNT